MIEYKSYSLANQVFERIADNIIDGTYAIGEVISETRLSQELGVSRTPIREALTKLAGDGLVKESPNGTVVLGITDKDVEDFFEVKRRIEILATRWAAANISDEDIERLRDVLEQQEFFAQKGAIDKVRDLDTEFHDIIYEASGSRVLFDILSPLHRKIAKYRRKSLSKPNRVMDSVAEHRGIFEAIAAHNTDKVDSLMMIHIEHAYKGMMS